MYVCTRMCTYGYGVVRLKGSGICECDLKLWLICFIYILSLQIQVWTRNFRSQLSRIFQHVAVFFSFLFFFSLLGSSSLNYWDLEEIESLIEWYNIPFCGSCFTSFAQVLGLLWLYVSLLPFSQAHEFVFSSGYFTYWSVLDPSLPFFKFSYLFLLFGYVKWLIFSSGYTWFWWRPCNLVFKLLFFSSVFLGEINCIYTGLQIMFIAWFALCFGSLMV